MKAFLVKTLLFLLPMVPAMYGLDYMVTQGLRHTQYYKFAVWNDMYNGKINADMIILGSSRGRRHFSTTILDSCLNLNTYALGFDGHYLLMDYYRYKVYREHNKAPKYIIQSVDLLSFNARKDLFNMEYFYPYMNDPLIREVTGKFEGMSVFDRYLPLVRYDGTLVQKGLESYLGLKKETNRFEKGYNPLEKTWDGSLDTALVQNPGGIQAEFDEETMELFEAFLKETKAEGVKVILVMSPYYYQGENYITNSDQVVAKFQALADKYDIPFLNYLGTDICYQKELFVNSQHMNRRGAEIFTRNLCADLKELE